MGMYLNPGNSGFEEIRNSRYVDKSGMISLINRVIGTKQKLICISRPRRFGKSFAAQMLCAYYDRTCDSGALFQDLMIAVDPKMNSGYEQHLNKYDVIYLDMTYIKPFSDGFRNTVSYLSEKIIEELAEAYPALKTGNELPSAMLHAVELTGRKFIMIIDEWDAPIRETPEIRNEYLEFLRTLFKGSGTTSKIFAAAYMTGILPIKKDGSQSAISDFQEYSMVFPGEFASYVGFTESEVHQLCLEYDCDFSEMKQWYDGYTLNGTDSVYNPNSVMKAVYHRRFHSYWTETSAAESLMGYISLDFDGLSGTIARLLGGVEVSVDTNGFSNDLITFRNRDDVLTLLIHLGYLGYDAETGEAFIPNKEIAGEFENAMSVGGWTQVMDILKASEQLLEATLRGDERRVAEGLDHAHTEVASILAYNDENSLACAISLAYYSARKDYLMVREFPSGRGFADVVFLPLPGTAPKPALVIELKYEKSAASALQQIRDRHYTQALEHYTGDILLVGVNYAKDSRDKPHSCIIEKLYRT